MRAAGTGGGPCPRRRPRLRARRLPPALAGLADRQLGGPPAARPLRRGPLRRARRSPGRAPPRPRVSRPAARRTPGDDRSTPSACGLLFLLDRLRRRPGGLRWALPRPGAGSGAGGRRDGRGPGPAAGDRISAPRRCGRRGWRRRTEARRRGAPAGLALRRYLPLAAPNAYGNSRVRRVLGAGQHQRGRQRLRGHGGAARRPARRWARRRFPQERLALGIAASACSPHLPVRHGSRRLLLPLRSASPISRPAPWSGSGSGEVRRWPLLIAALGLGGDRRLGLSRPSRPADPARLAIFRFGWLRWQLRFLGLATLLLAAPRPGGGAARPWRSRGSRRRSLAELLLLHRPANPPMPRQLPLPVNGPHRASCSGSSGRTPSAAPATGSRRSAGISRPISQRSTA